MLFMVQMKMGKYGAFFGVIDPQTVMVNLAKFNISRMDEIARFRAIITAEQIEAERIEHAKNCISREQYEKIKAK